MSSPITHRVSSNLSGASGTHSIPTTPRMGSSPTPNLSSPDTPRHPDTPYAHLQTPASHGGLGTVVSSSNRPVLPTIRKDSIDSIRSSIDSDNQNRDDGLIEKKTSRALDFFNNVKESSGRDNRVEIDLAGSSHSQMSRAKAASHSSMLGSAMEDQGEGSSRNPRPTQQTRRVVQSLNHDGQEDDDENGLEIPEDEELNRMRCRLDEMDLERKNMSDGWSQRDELVQMVKSLLTPMTRQLPFLREQVSTQQATIVALQEQAKVIKAMSSIEQDRHRAERAQWQAEIRALIRQRESEMVSGSRPRKMLDLDVGYHQELEAANKRLQMENRLMAPRLADSQRQIDNLVNELRHLRAHVIVDTKVLTEDANLQRSPATWSEHHSPHQMQTPSAGNSGVGVAPLWRKSISRGRTTMGDARAEHLLLAAKKVRSMRAQDNRVGHLTLAELKRHGVVGPDGGAGYGEGYGEDVVVDEEEVSDRECDGKMSEVGGRRSSSALKPTTPGGAMSGLGLGAPSAVPSSTKGKSRRQSESNISEGTPLLPRARKTSKRNFPAPPTTPSRTRTIPQVPQTTPGGNFNDLLRAAEMVIPGSPRGVSGSGLEGGLRLPPTATMSATRSTSLNFPMSSILRGDSESPSKKPRRNPPSTVEWASLASKSSSSGCDNGSVYSRNLRLDDLDTVGQRLRSVTGSPLASPTERNSSPTFREITHSEDHETSALDILAQASQLDQVQSSAVASQPLNGPAGGATGGSAILTSAARLGGMLVGHHVGSSVGVEAELVHKKEGESGGSTSPKSSTGESTLGPAIDLGSVGRGKKPSGRVPISSLISKAPSTESQGPRTPEPISRSAREEDKSGSASKVEMITPLTCKDVFIDGPRPGTERNTSTTAISNTNETIFATPRDYNSGRHYRDPSESPLTASVGRRYEPVYYDFEGVSGGGKLTTSPGAFQSPKGTSVPGLGRYGQLSSGMINRRQRSAYLKWTDEEDELLTRAIAQHGEKWDLVSKGVPTRSYHQVRQRWLRKTGAFDKKNSNNTNISPGGGGTPGRGGVSDSGGTLGTNEDGVEVSPLSGKGLVWNEPGSPSPGGKRKNV